MRSTDFFDTHPVFTLDEAVKTLAPVGGRSGTVERLKHHLKTGRLKRVSRAVYAAVPPGLPEEGFQPDPYLVAAAVRPDGVFSYHSALSLLGAAHSEWNRHTLFVEKRRRPIQLEATEIHFLEHPSPMQPSPCRQLGIRRVEHGAMLLKTTGPERTLVEGFRRPAAVGGLEELVNCASGFTVLDLELLEKILHCYDIANLWAATGWFLEQFRNTFHVPGEVLDRFAQNTPKAPQYLERNRRNGALAARWNILLPQELMNMGGPDEREP